ncbi:exported hypothetical protein [Frankia sp. AiPs1]
MTRGGTASRSALAPIGIASAAATVRTLVTVALDEARVEASPVSTETCGIPSGTVGIGLATARSAASTEVIPRC